MTDHRFFVIEGPAGSGKTTLINTLTMRNQAELVHPLTDFPRPRAYLGPGGLVLSQIKDTLASLALLTRDSRKIPLLLDRWCVSQAVYGAIRRGEDPQPHMAQAAVEAGLWTMQVMDVELSVRQGGLGPICSYQVTYIFLLPTIDLLRRTRDLTCRTFPYAPEAELLHYRTAEWGLRMLSENHPTGFPADLNVITLHPNNLTELVHLPDRLFPLMTAGGSHEVVS